MTMFIGRSVLVGFYSNKAFQFSVFFCDTAFNFLTKIEKILSLKNFGECRLYVEIY